MKLVFDNCEVFLMDTMGLSYTRNGGPKTYIHNVDEIPNDFPLEIVHHIEQYIHAHRGPPAAPHPPLDTVSCTDVLQDWGERTLKMVQYVDDRDTRARLVEDGITTLRQCCSLRENDARTRSLHYKKVSEEAVQWILESKASMDIMRREMQNNFRESRQDLMESIKLDNECSVCAEPDSRHAIAYPCMHATMCLNCWYTSNMSACPVCRCRVEKLWCGRFFDRHCPPTPKDGTPETPPLAQEEERGEGGGVSAALPQ